MEGKGYIGLRLVREDVHAAAAFGKEHPEGWIYVADTSKVRVANPLNLVYLRRIQQLPNVRAYVSVVPSRMLRVVATALRPIFRPDVIVRTREEPLATTARGS
jgi:hypothetical protein